MTAMTADTHRSGLDTTRPHAARVWNYWLGGKDNFKVDRDFGDQVAQFFPQIVAIARESRAALVRIVRFLAEDCGVTQFLDIGTGLPTSDNTHQVAQKINPQARIVYVDNDPLVLSHARALLTSTPEGRCDYIDGDARNPQYILRAAADTLDFSRPVAVVLFGLLGNIEKPEQAQEIVRQLTAGLAPGSYLVINDGTNEHNRTGRDKATDASLEAEAPYWGRRPEVIERFFTVAAATLLEPGLVPVNRWRPDPMVTLAEPLDAYCGVARLGGSLSAARTERNGDAMD